MDAGRHQKHAELLDRTNSVGIDFLRTDIEAALTFIRVAETSSSPETRARNYAKAIKGYRTVLHFLPRVVPTVEESADMHRKLDLIRLQLVQAGFPANT